MRFREGGSLDTSGISDRRGMGGGRGIAVGGGGLGLVGVIIVVILNLAGGGGGSAGGSGFGGLAGLGNGEQADNGQLQERCQQVGDANASEECAVVAEIDSIQEYWGQTLGGRYTKTDTVFFNGSTQTSCGAADSGTGPFYCPGDRLVYIDLSFFDQLTTQFGAEGGAFVDAYVLAHEYGHHVQDILGTNQQVTPGDTGPTGGSVRLELQADCYAGTWANHATTVPDASGQPLITEITQDDVNRALDAASRIGDDFIQKNLGSGRVDQNSFTHGTSAQREKWFTTGYRSGKPEACDTFGPADLG
ncbi:MAG TPA: neutral zinc metallopeptidase [Blastococcus sp.]|nr:neutral zinc metallopeptidase [Blastococcus sp.]